MFFGPPALAHHLVLGLVPQPGEDLSTHGVPVIDAARCSDFPEVVCGLTIE
jgi:hypothetical protein